MKIFKRMSLQKMYNCKFKKKYNDNVIICNTLQLTIIYKYVFSNSYMYEL